MMSYATLAVAEKLLQLPWMTFADGENNETFRWMLSVADEIVADRKELPHPMTTSATGSSTLQHEERMFRRRGHVEFLITLDRTKNVLNNVGNATDERMAMTVEQGTQTDNFETIRPVETDVITWNDVASGNSRTAIQQ